MLFKVLLISLCVYQATALEWMFEDDRVNMTNGGSYGVDVSQYTSESGFACLKGKGVTHAVVRCFRSTGSPDPNAPASLKNAQSAGLRASAYIFPCPRCSSSGSEQAKSAVQALRSAGAPFERVWLDIEGPQYWHDSTSENQAFFKDLVAGLRSEGVSIGIYASRSGWDPIMGSGFSAGSSYPLWYAHYDDSPSFSDFSSFGGWYSPSIKQYNDEGFSSCGVSADVDWAQSWP